MAATTIESLAQGSAVPQPLWAQLRVPDRARYLRRAAQAVVDELDELVALFAQAHDRTPGEVAALELLPAIDGLTWLAETGARALRDRRLGAPPGPHPPAPARLPSADPGAARLGAPGHRRAARRRRRPVRPAALAGGRGAAGRQRGRAGAASARRARRRAHRAPLRAGEP